MTTSNMTKLTRQKLKSPRLLMILSTLAILATGIATIVSLILGGYDFVHYVFPSLMVLADIAFLTLSLFTNYRFRYAIPIPLVYLGVSAALTAVTVITDGGTGGTDVFTHLAFYSFIVVHLLAVLTVVFAYMHAAGVGKKPAGMRNTTAIAFLLLVASVSVYSYSMFIYGWFGQGAVGVERTLEYSYDESDNTYVVSGVLGGRGDTIVVPSEFNGIKVKEVDCSIFDTPMVTNVYLNCDIGTELRAPEFLYKDGVERTVYVKEYQHFSEMLLKKSYSERNDHFIGVVNQMQPSAIEDGKVYVTFTYNYEDLLAVGGNVLPMWVGNKGDVIDRDDFSDFDYINHPYVTEDGNENKFWAYDNLNHRIYNGVSCFGSAVNESIDHATVNFETLYKVKVDEDNDTLYTVPVEFRYATDISLDSDNIFTSSEADTWLATFASRPGFDYEWTYQPSSSDAFDRFTSLSGVLYDGITIAPKWTMKAPTITECKLENASLIYGETASFSSAATPALEEFVLKYEWVHNGTVMNPSGETAWSIDESHPDDTGSYILNVTSSYANSELTSTSTVTLQLNVAKRPIRVNWTPPSDNTYTGYNQEINLALNEEDMFKPTEREVPTLVSTVLTSKDAGRHLLNAELATLSDRYAITNETASFYYEIKPASAAAIWDTTPIYYNGHAQAYTAKIERLAGESDLDLTISGLKKPVGTYTATAASPDPNYVVTTESASCSYTILPLEIDLTWENLLFTYSDAECKPKASFNSVGEDIEELGSVLYARISGGQKNAGTHTATAVFDNPNYVISEATASQSFTIEPMEVVGTWTNTSLVYNGAAQYPTVKANNKYNKALTITVSFEDEADKKAINANTYVATAVPTDTNYVLSNPTNEFVIEKRTLTLQWTVPTSGYTYNGKGQQPTPAVKNNVTTEVISLDYQFVNEGLIIGSVPQNAAATPYVVTASLADNDINKNYVIKTETETAEYKINPKTINAEWTVIEDLVYNAEPQIGVTVVLKGVDDEDVAYTLTGHEQTDAAQHTAKIKSDNANYVVSSTTAEKKFTIGKAVANVYYENVAFTYNGKEQSPTVTAEGINNVAVEITISGKATNAGNHTLRLSSKNSNYTLDTTSISYTIDKAEASVIWGAATVFTYSGSNQAPTASITNLANPSSTIRLTVSGAKTDVGTYTATASTTNTNYTLVGDLTTEFTINPRSVNVVWESLTLTYSGVAQTPVAKATGVNSYNIPLTVDGATKNVGTGYATASTADKNYTLMNAEKSFNIIARTVDVVWNGLTAVFDGTPKTPTAYINLVGEDVTGTNARHDLVVSGSGTNAGTYSVSTSYDNPNYTLSGASQTLTISKREVTVEWSNISNLVYNGTSKEASASFKNISGDTITLHVTYQLRDQTYDAMVSAGTYTLSVSLAGTYYENDYTLKNPEITVNVAQKEIEITWSNTTFTYDGQSHAPTATVKAGGICGSDNVGLTVSGAAINAATTHRATAAISNPNYKIAGNNSCEFRINPKVIEIDWGQTEYSITSGMSVSLDHVKIKSGEIVSGDAVTLELSWTRINQSRTVIASIKGADAVNYEISNPQQDFDVEIR